MVHQAFAALHGKLGALYWHGMPLSARLLLRPPPPSSTMHPARLDARFLTMRTRSSGADTALHPHTARASGPERRGALKPQVSYSIDKVTAYLASLGAPDLSAHCHAQREQILEIGPSARRGRRLGLGLRPHAGLGAPHGKSITILAFSARLCSGRGVGERARPGQ